MVKSHTHSLALQVVSASPPAKIVGEPRLWLVDALDACPASIVARRLGCSQELVRGWRTGRSLPNLDHLARAPRRFTLRVLASLDAHVRGLDQIAAVDPDEALRLLYLAFGALLADLSRKPLDQRTPEEGPQTHRGQGADRLSELIAAAIAEARALGLVQVEIRLRNALGASSKRRAS